MDVLQLNGVNQQLGGSRGGSSGSVEPIKVKKANILTILFLMKKGLESDMTFLRTPHH